MSLRRAAPGPQVSQGRIRVDAARAIQKLREYQLTDRAAWVLEAIRAAVAAGATKIELRGDSNDIWIGWHGTPWEAELLPRLFDELVSPEVSDDKQQVRLLAAAVNSALGMNPAYVDVYTVTGAGQGKRARYTPEVLAAPENELGEAALRHVAVEEHEPPTDISCGVLVHLRRRASLSLLSYWIGEPPELPLARAACRDIAVPLVINEDLVLQRDARRDLVRIPLDDGLSGFVAITNDLVDPAACFEVAERGVVLARYSLDVLGFEARVPTTVRVFLDADRLPTNASRSQVRRDVHPIATAERRAKQVIAKAIEQLAPLVTNGTADIAPKARQAALSLLAANVGGHPVGWQHSIPLLAPLTKIPLVRNAFGEPRTVHAEWTSHIHSESSPLDEDLKPFLSEMLWAPPGDAVHTLIAAATNGPVIQVATTRRHVRFAKQQRKAHKKFLSHAKREVKVQTSVYPRARVSAGVMVERSCVPQDVFTDVTGEICVYTESRNGAVVLCVDGRELERIEFTSEIPFDAVLDSSRLAPGERYRGVRRDGAFAYVDRALRSGVVRAVETLALESGRVIETDMPLIRSALLLAKDLGFALTGPLTHVKVWRSATGEYVSYVDLLASPYIGVIAEAQTLIPPAGRLIVHANGDARDALRRLFGNRVLSYHKAVDARPFEPQRFAANLPSMSSSVSLAMKDANMAGVISLASNSRLHLRHRGVALGDRLYTHELVPSMIVVDSDAFVPNEKWTGVVEDAGISKASFRDWELALLRAIASRVTGLQVPDLIVSGEITFGHRAFESLAAVLVAHDPRNLLGGDLYDRLCAHPLFECLGSTELHSADALGAANPHGIFYLTTRDELPVDNFQPVIASEGIAQLLAKLSRRPMHDGKAELRARQRAVLHKQRLAELLAKPQEPVQLTSDLPTVEFRGKLVRGFIGLTEDRPHVRVHVENRPFATLDVAVGYPLVAAVELARAHCNDTLDGIPNLTQEEIVEDLRDAVPALLETIANTRPRLLGEPGPARRMLAAFLNSGKIAKPLRDLLRSVPAFATIQGDYRSIQSVEDPPTYLMVAATTGEWLTPSEGESPTLHDAPILRVARVSDELNAIIGKLHMDVVGDVTTEITRLQARRRMARGLLPTPKLPEIAEAMKRPLKSFGDLTKKLGHGEVGFASGSQSSLLIHEEGVLNRTVDIDVMPAIQVALEASHDVFDHPQITRIAQDLAVELVRTALPAEIPIAMRRNLARALLARRIPPAALGSAAVFQSTKGTWIDWAALAPQFEKFGDVWAVTSTPAHEPLDPERIVIHLDASDIEIATKHGHEIINARIELELDGKARVNRERWPVTRLALPSQDGVLASVELDGNGKSAPRGIVAVLAPQMGANRGLYAHREMRPFDKTEDVCRWPTIAVIDDARFTPDRTWSVPKKDDVWHAIAKAVREASEEALATLGDVPGEALAELRVTNHVCSDVKALREAPRTQIRGVLWLSAVPYTPINVVFRHAGGIRSFVPAHGLAVGGSLAIHAEDALDIDQALEQLCGIAHAKLVRMLLKDEELDRDIVAAHVAHAIAITTVKPTEVHGIKFGCFAPNEIEPRQLASIFRRTDSISIVKAGTKDIDGIAFVDDGSELAKVVRVHLGDRISKYAPPPKVKRAPPPPPTHPPVSTQRPAPQVRAPAPAPARKPPPPPKPHELQPLVEALTERVARLGIQTFSWEIADAREPMLHYSGVQLVLGGKNALLRKVAAELASDSIHAEPAIDALAAHAVSMLNLARTDITDASEMHALGVLLASPPSAGQPRSRRSS